MVDPKELEYIIKECVSKLKKSYKMESGKPVIKEDADFHDTYKAACEYAERVKIHAEIGSFPERLFRERAPNQSEKEFKYMKGNFKQTTLPVYTDFYSTISRAWSDGNWSITYQDDEPIFKDNTFQQYVENDIRVLGSLEKYWKGLITHVRNVDPNGIVVVKPEPQEVIIDNSTGEFIIDTSVLPKPQPYYYRSDQIVYDDEEVGYMVLTEERSDVELYNKTQKVGFIFEFYDDSAIYVIKQTGKFTDWTFNVEEYFRHDWGKVPATKLKAVPQFIGDKLVYIPEFLYACDNLDLALMNAQYLQVSISNTCFPYRVMVGNSCDYEEREDNGQFNSCNGMGYITRSDQSKHQCPKCGGSGLKDRVSPLGVLLLSKEDWSGQGDKSFADRAMYYVSPDVTTLEFNKSKIEEDTNNARKILHLHTSNTWVKGSERLTATGMTLDQKAQYAFIKPISDNLFSGYEYILSAIGYMRYGDKFKAPTFVYPNTFDYNTEEDYLTQLSEAQKAGLPPFIIYTIFYKFLNTLYYYEKKTADVFRLIVKADRILTMQSDEAQLKLAKGLVEKWEIVLHDSAISFVNELLETNPGLFEMDLPKQVDLLIAKSKEVSNGIVSPSQSLQQSTVSSILGG